MRRFGIFTNAQGYTLIEVLLVVGILTIILGISAPVLLTFRNTNELDVAANTLAQYLYQAQANSRSQYRDCPWGVTINSHQITLFCGDSYASRNSSFDTVYIVPVTIAIAASSEIVYSKYYGLPADTGTFELAGTTKTATLTVNNKGMVEY